MALAVIIMAAGKGTRMKSDLPKVLHQANGRPLVDYVIDTALALEPWKTILVVGHLAELVRQATVQYTVTTVLQEPQLGTGHAVMQAEHELRDFHGDVLILSGDAPLVRTETLHELIALHRTRKAAATVLTAELADPTGYGRIVRKKDDGNVLGIVEQKDGSEEELQIREINSGVYVFDARMLFRALDQVNTNNAQNEYYLTDVFGICFRKGLKVCAFKTGNPEEILGINTPDQLREAERELFRRGEEPA
ncbi:MAG: NTP transferase domain-containing protein [Chlorobiaceae bacterium]|nr:NTP transferase domain-containing protein [Chlorobiaceae bacterium]NTV61253.1 NTP transferase domain-containing protein [Chlorobiaceae bacterium]